MVETMTSRAAKEERSAIPIFQSNPSGAIAGSMRRPARPAKESRSETPAIWFWI